MDIKIGAIRYRVVTRKDLHDDRNKLSGEIDYDLCQIRLESRLLAQMRPVILWHEIIHGILTQAGYTEHNEGQIEALAYGVVQLLHDNPDLIGMLRETYKV